jgi:glycosyltransferase involved in cell wall biosynthesis
VRAAVHVGQLLQPVPGGIGRYVRHLVAALPGAGVDVHAFAAGPRPLDGVDYSDLGRPAGPVRYELWHRVRRPAVRVPGDVVHATSLAVPPPGGRPLVVTVHDIVFLRRPEHLTARGVAFHRRGLELARREGATFVVPSEYGRDDLAREGVDPARVHVAPHGVEAPDLGGTPPVDGPYLLFAATLEPRKGASDLLDAHARLRRSHPDLRLVLAGPPGWGTPPDTDRPGVVTTGNLGDAELDAAYRHAVAMVLPSRYEGFGFQVVEAMARGCPVVTSDAACLPEVVGGAGVVVPTGDVDALTAAVDQLVGSDARRAELAAAGRARAAAFTWERSAALHARAYEAAVAG